jgi:ribosomal-protein-alanine N-acetyltransferase
MIILETERLFLRHFHIADGEAMDRVFGDPDVMKFGSGPKNPEWVREWLHRCLEDYHKLWGFGLWAVVEKNTRTTMGFCGLSYFPDVGGKPEIEIGYRLAKAHWGHGYATEAARAVRDHAWTVLCLRRVISLIDPRNTASIRVAQKVGMQYEKDVLFKGYTDGVYAIEHPTPAPHP